MSRPTDRSCEIEPLGDIDSEAGEFWQKNPFLITKNGENLSAYERNKLYMNVNGSQFIDASFASNADLDSDSRSAIDADFDNDGDPDLLVASVGGGTLRLFGNQLNRGNQFLNVQLKGTRSNRLAIGSRIVLEIGDRKIVRDLFPRNNCWGMGPVNLLIGVGQAQTIDRLTVRWPTGKTQVIEDVPTNKTAEIEED